VDYIKEALVKAKASLERPPVREHREIPAPLSSRSARAQPVEKAAQSWSPRQVNLTPRHLEAQRVVSAATSDPSHVAFNLLRTRVRKAFKDNGWKRLAITSPTQGCGKTMVAMNLAFSLARTSDCRTVVMDLDLKKPAIARTLGISAPASIGAYLEGKAPLEQCEKSFFQVAENLIVGANSHAILHSSEAIQGPSAAKLISSVAANLSPDVIIFDLPPLRGGDDALAFLPLVDTCLLVVAAGVTKIAEADECERQISQLEKLLGVVLNKCSENSDQYYY